MFIGIKKINRSNFNEKKFFFFCIPVYTRIKTNTFRIRKFCGITFYKDKKLESFYRKNDDVNDNNITSILNLIKISDKQKNIDILFHSLSKNLRELKRFENNIIKKFPDLTKD